MPELADLLQLDRRADLPAIRPGDTVRVHVRVVEVPVQHYPRTSGKQTGANPRVVLRAFGELLAFRAEMRKVEKAA